MITGQSGAHNVGGIMKNAPNSLIWAVSLCFLGVVAAFVALAGMGADTTDLRTFLNTALNIVSTLLSGAAVVVGGAAFASSRKVQDMQENGHLPEKVEEGVRNAIREDLQK
jgi:short subunit fatty acids transporter